MRFVLIGNYRTLTAYDLKLQILHWHHCKFPEFYFMDNTYEGEFETYKRDFALMKEIHENIFTPESVELDLLMHQCKVDEVTDVNISHAFFETFEMDTFAIFKNMRTLSMNIYLEEIPYFAFMFNEKLEDISIGLAVERICSKAFYNCNIKKIYIPSTVKIIEKSAFNRCDEIYVHLFSKPENWDDEWYDKSKTKVYWKGQV